MARTASGYLNTLLRSVRLVRSSMQRPTRARRSPEYKTALDLEGVISCKIRELGQLLYSIAVFIVPLPNGLTQSHPKDSLLGSFTLRP